MEEEDPSRPGLRARLEAERAHLEAATAGLRGLCEELRREMEGRLPETDLSVPVRHGPYLYFRREERGLPYRIHCRLRDEPGAAEEVLLDENRLAGEGPFQLGGFAVSPDHARLAYACDAVGDERFEIRIRDLATGEELARLSDGSGHLAWASDSRTLFWIGLDDRHRRARLLRHETGGETALVYEEPDERFHLAVGRSESGAFLLMTASSRSATEVRVLDASDPGGVPRVVRPRRDGVKDSLSHAGDSFYLLTSEDGAPGGKVLAAPCAGGPWREAAAARPGVVIEDIRAFSGHLVLFLREQGRPALRVLDLRTGEPWNVPLPDAAGVLSPGENPELDTAALRIVYTSLTLPDSVYEVDMASRRVSLLKRQEVPGYDPEAYVSARIRVVSGDGAAVPVSFVYRRELFESGRNPLLLYGYGAYGLCVEPAFSASRLSLLDRGFIFAIAHVRGGGELGPDWHAGGKLLSKPNSFRDFIACAEALVRFGYGAPGRIAALGESAGGLLVGAVANQRPDLFAAIVARVPFVDVLGSLLDPENPLAPADREELGDPRDPLFRDAIAAWSPYDNVRPQDYPAFLVTAALYDPRVPFWEPVQWVARLRAARTGRRPVLLRVEESGHDGPSGRCRALEAEAFFQAFLLDALAGAAR